MKGAKTASAKYYYYYAAFNAAPCVGHKDDESQAREVTNTKASSSMTKFAECANSIAYRNDFLLFWLPIVCLQCFDAVGWAVGRASGL